MRDKIKVIQLRGLELGPRVQELEQRVRDLVVQEMGQELVLVQGPEQVQELEWEQGLELALEPELEWEQETLMHALVIVILKMENAKKTPLAAQLQMELAVKPGTHKKKPGDLALPLSVTAGFLELPT